MGYAERRHLDRLWLDQAGLLDEEPPEYTPLWSLELCPECGSPEHWSNFHSPHYVHNPETAAA